MRKVLVSIENCMPGMKMAETIHNEYGAVIIAEHTILDEHLINKLSNLGFDRVKVYDEFDNIKEPDSSELFKAQYAENVDTVKEILHDISDGKSVDINKVNYVSESIVMRINENRDIVSCISRMKTADEYTYTHSVNVSLLSMLIGKWLRMDLEKIREIVQAGLLHDIGKSMIPQELLNKPGNLTPEEYEEMKMHPYYGFRIAENMPGLSEDIKKAILLHHEREDGSGYPLGLTGSQINEFAKIIAVADIYDAMTSKRIYRKKESVFGVLELLENNMYGILDTRIVRAFLTNIAAYYIGDMVRLNTGETGEIVYINPMHISQPLVKAGDKYYDLSKDTNIKIVEML